ncbi:MAG: hypothetical protein V1918_02960 [Planctomycetota bacterium]
MRRHSRRFFRAAVLGWALLLVGAGGGARGASSALPPAPEGQTAVLEQNPDLLAVVRISDLDACGKRLDAWLEAVAPRWTEPGAAGNALAAWAFVPARLNLPQGAFLEVLLFNPKRIEASPLVLAFPSEDPQGYIRSLAAEAGVSLVDRLDEIFHLGEEAAGAAADLYLAPVPSGPMLFGRDRKAVDMARAIYARAGRGLLPPAEEDAVAVFHCKRLTAENGYGPEIEGGLLHLREDIASDLLPQNAADRTRIERVLQGGSDAMRALAGQARLGRASLCLADSPSASEGAEATGALGPATALNLVFEWDEGAVTSVPQGVAPSGLTLPEYLPPRTVSLDWSALPPEGAGRILAFAAGLVSEGLSEPVEAPVQQDLETLLQGFLALRPVETVSALVAPPEGATEGGPLPDSVGLVRFLPAPGQSLAEQFSALWDTADRILGPSSAPAGNREERAPANRAGPLRDAFRRSGFDVTLERYPADGVERETNVPVGRVLLRAGAVAREGSAGSPKSEPLLEETYYTAVVESTLVVAAGPRARATLGEVVRALARRRPILSQGPAGRALLGGLGIGPSPRPLVPQGEALFHASACAPLRYIRLAASAPAGIGAAPSPTAQASAARWVEEFQRVATGGMPFLALLAATPANEEGLPGFSIRLRLPHAALRDLVRACLQPQRPEE